MDSETNMTKYQGSTVKRLNDIIFENEHFIAINKPAGLLSIPDRNQSEPSLKDLLLEKYGSIFTVHRLDKDTSGIILFAKDEVTHKYLSVLFEERKMEKERRKRLREKTNIVVSTPFLIQRCLDSKEFSRTLAYWFHARLEVSVK